MRLAVLTSHPIQYHAPLFRHLAQRLDLHVFFAHNPTPKQQAAAGFAHEFSWDVDLTSGYAHTFLRNISKAPDTSRFSGCDTPEIAAHLRSGQFDAVLSFGWNLKSYLQGVWAAKRLGLPALVRGDSHLQSPRSATKKALKKIAFPLFLRVFDAALYVGARSRSYYDHYYYPKARMFYSPHCVDTVRFQSEATAARRNELRRQLGVKPEDRLVLFAGRLISLKRPLDVVEAVAALRRQGIPAQVLVAGSGELEGAMQQRATALDTPIHLLGFRNQSQMPAAYAAADALVLPSTTDETWGLVCNEALASGTPIVISDGVGCAPDLASDGRVGRTFPVGDTARCAEKLSALFGLLPSDKEIAAVSARFSFSAASDGIVEGLAAVVRAGKGGTSSVTSEMGR